MLHKVWEQCCGHGGLAARLVTTDSVTALRPPGERMGRVPLWLCCAFTPSRSFIFSPGLFTPEDLMSKYVLLVLFIALLLRDW